MTFQPDPKKPARVRLKPHLYAALLAHLMERCGGRCECGCGRQAHSGHHVIGGPGRSDIAENLVCLNGSGSTGCHGALTSANLSFSPETGTYVAPETVRSGIRARMEFERHDVLAYVLAVKGLAWLDKHYPVD